MVLIKKRNFHVIIMFLIVRLILSKQTVKNEKQNECVLPNGCRIDSVYGLPNLYASEFVYTKDWNGIVCDVKDTQTTKLDAFNEKLAQIFNDSLCFENQNVTSMFDLKFPLGHKLKLDRNHNLEGILAFQSILWIYFTLHLINVNGFDVNLDIQIPEVTDIYIDLIKANVDFYAKEKKIESCQDLLTAFGSTWSPNSIFQIQSNDAFTELIFFNCRFK